VAALLPYTNKRSAEALGIMQKQITHLSGIHLKSILAATGINCMSKISPKLMALCRHICAKIKHSLDGLLWLAHIGHVFKTYLS